MRTFLIVAGAVWFILAWVMLLSLALAARRRAPLPEMITDTTRQPILDSTPKREVAPTTTSDTTVVASYELEPRPMS